MKIRYMGTAALERIPAVFCNCETCQRAMAAGGRNIMTRSQALIDDRLLIDLNSETYTHFLQLGRTLWDIDHLLITHAHCDHFSFEEFCCRCAGGTKTVKNQKLKVYTSRGAIDRMWASLNARKDKYTRGIADRVELVALQYYCPINVGGYTVTPLPAFHADEEQAYIFLIERDGKSLFYGHDTGLFDETLDHWLVANNKHIDFLSLDCTKGDVERDYKTHMSMSEGRQIADRFLKKGIIDQNTILYYNHFSHNCGMIYDELTVASQKYGFQVSYDGLEVSF